MLARRSRLSIKPNLGKKTLQKCDAGAEQVSETSAVTQQISVSNEVSSTSSDIGDVDSCAPGVSTTTTNHFPSAASNSYNVQEPAAVPVNPPAETVIVCAASDEKGKEFKAPCLLSPTAISATHSEIPIPSNAVTSGLENLSPKGHRSRTNSQSEDVERPKKRLFTGTEPLDTRSMRMMDLIVWNPRAESKMTQRKLTDSNSVRASPAPVARSPAPARIAAPQVKIGPDGRMVIDEASLIVPESANDASVWETVDEDRMSRKINSMSFRTRAIRRGTPWTEKETDLFYEILRCTGPDFGLMHQFFPSRARNELKMKYNREERINWERMKNVMSMPAYLDESLYERVAYHTEAIEQEALEKQQKKEKKKTRKEWRENGDKKPDESVLTESWNESTADLEAEAEQIITELELAEKKKTKKKKRVARKKKVSAEPNSTPAQDDSETESDQSVPSSSSSSASSEDEDFRPTKRRKIYKRRAPAKKSKVSVGAEQILKAAEKAVRKKDKSSLSDTINSKEPEGYEEFQDPATSSASDSALRVIIDTDSEDDPMSPGPSKKVKEVEEVPDKPSEAKATKIEKSGDLEDSSTKIGKPKESSVRKVSVPLRKGNRGFKKLKPNLKNAR